MFSPVVVNRMPNVHVNKIIVTEHNNLTTISCDLFLLDFTAPRRKKWYLQGAMDKIKINASLVEGLKDIKAVSEGIVKLKEKDAISIRSSKNVGTSIQSEYTKFAYRIVFKLKRKISNDSSLFFYTTKNIGRFKSAKAKQNHGVFKTSKLTKAPRSRYLYGAVKHIPIFNKGKKIKKLHKYSHKTTGAHWHGLVKYSSPAQSFLALVPGTAKRPHLNAHPVDNNLVLYNLPMTKKAKNLLLPPKIRQHKKNKKIKKINSLFNRSYKYEMDDEYDRNGNMHKFFILNLCNLALRKSIYARKIFNLDKDLFMDISNNLSIGKMKIIRSKFKNTSRVKAQRKTKYKKGRRRYNTKKNRNRKIVAHINNRKSAIMNRFFDLDDVGFKRPRQRVVSNLEIIDAGLPTEMTPLYFVDRSIKEVGKGKISYKVDVDFDDIYYRYIRTTLNDILRFKRELLKIKNNLVKGRAYSNLEKKIKGSYIEKYYKKFNFNTRNKNADALKQSPLVMGLAAIDRAALLLGIDREDIEIDNKINFTKATLDTIRRAISDISKISTVLQKTYKVVPFFNKTFGRGKSVKSIKSKKRKVVEHSFMLDVDKMLKRDLVSYEYLTFNDSLKMNKTSLRSRANIEFQKYYSSPPSDIGNMLGDVSGEVRNKLLDMNTSMFMYMTPSRINKLKQQIDTSSLDKRISTKHFVEIKNIRKKVLKNKNLKTLNLSKFRTSQFKIEFENSEKDKDNEDILQIKKYLGNTSPLINRKFLAKRLINLKSKNTLGKVSGKMVFNSKKIARMSKYDFAKDNNQLYNDIVSNKIDASMIPLQIKSLILNRSPSVKSNYLLNNDDIFQNPSTDEIAYQMYGNIVELKYIDDFKMTKDGLYDMISTVIFYQYKVVVSFAS
jgi:hypothetical protein